MIQISYLCQKNSIKRTDYEIIRRRYISLLTDFGFKQELREYEDSLKAYRDIKNSIDTAKEEGREEGRVEGIAKEKLATAKRLLGMGLTQEQVAKGTDLSIEDIERLV